MIVFWLSKKELAGKGLGIWIQGWRFSYSQRTGLDPEPVVSKKNQRTSQRTYLNRRFFSGYFMKYVGSLKNFQILKSGGYQRYP